jgi:hypothetical protein
MAIFRSLRVKDKTYVFKFGGNNKLKTPAKAVFSRFLLSDENFFKPTHDVQYKDVDFSKVGKRDTKETEKLFKVFISSYLENKMEETQWDKVDGSAFLKECIDHFENFFVEKDGQLIEIATIDQFLELPEEGWNEIARELYGYARRKDEFTMGESKA